jgi:hypothetical protein
LAGRVRLQNRAANFTFPAGGQHDGVASHATPEHLRSYRCKCCLAQRQEPRRQEARGRFCRQALTRSRSTHPYWGIATETKPDFESPTSGTGHLQSL